MESYWVHLLFRGDRCSPDTDEYLKEFKANGLIAITVPILRFSFKNLDQLSKQLVDMTLRTPETICGLIITSPRVVEALKRAMRILEPPKRLQVLNNFDTSLVFVVGEKSGKHCETVLGLGYNRDSSLTGNGHSLCQYIRNHINDNSVRSKASTIKLLYPKGSLSGTTIEDSLIIDNCGSFKLELAPVEVYDTSPNESLAEDSLLELRKLNIQVKHCDKIIINLIFFSPSGVHGYLEINQPNFMTQIRSIFSKDDVDLKYSSIGKTTEAALQRHNLEVFCVSEHPNQFSLVESILRTRGLNN